MNYWFLFSLAAPLLWSFSNVIDAAARRNFVKSDLSLSWLTASTRLPIIPLLFWWGGFQVPGLSTALWLVFSGLVWLLPFALYFRSLAVEETSRVTLLLELIPIFTLSIAWALIGEKLTGAQGWAFLIILAGNIVAALRRGEGKWHWSKAFWFMALANLGWALSDVLFKKHAAGFDNYFAPATFYSLGMFLVAPLILLHRRSLRAIVAPFRGLPARAWTLIGLDQFTGLAGTLAFSYALTLGKASLTAVITGMQPLFVFILSFLLRRLVPEIPREELTKNAIISKSLAFLLIVIGLWMLS